VLVAGLLLTLSSGATAQLRAPGSGGVVALEEALRPLGVYQRLLIIGAHPDDEDTELLTLAVRKLGAEAAYLSLNRGEGGQNLIGPELGEALGLIRTEELLAARGIDGARQYFTRAYDFGYSKTLEDTWLHWPRDTILKDVVRTVRRFQPQVIVSVFSGTPNDGHGQHQAAGWAAHEAFRVAGDSTVFPELLAEEGLTPWTPVKLYRGARFNRAAATLHISSGDLDPVIGQSYHQIAMRSRSQHRSQDMGRLQTMGPSEVRVELVEDRSGTDEGGAGLFAGVDTTLSAILEHAGMQNGDAARAMAAYAERIRHAKAVPRPTAIHALADSLELAWRDLEAVLEALADRDEATTSSLLVPPALDDQGRHLAAAILAARGIVVDAVANRNLGTPGDTLVLQLNAWNAGPGPARMTMWPQQRIGTLEGLSNASARPILPGQVDSLRVRLIPDRMAANPYFLQAPRRNGVYQWVAPEGVAASGMYSVLGLPFAPAPVRGAFTLMLDSGSPTVHREASYRYRDQAVGEVRLPLVILPTLDVTFEPRHTVLPAGGEPRHFTVTLTNHSASPVAGTVRLEVPSGWPRVNSQVFSLTAGSQVAYSFPVTVPSTVSSGTFRIGAVAQTDDGVEYRDGVVAVDYPHIHTRTFTRRAEADVRVTDMAMPALARIGYIRGAADRVPEALWDIGLPVTIIDDAMLAQGALEDFDAIVVGSRAYEVNRALVLHNDRLLAYAHAGGLLLVQYQQYQFFDGDFAPYPMSVGGRPLIADGATSDGATPGRNTHDRVADQTAPVRVLDPDNPVVAMPNRLTDADWEGWVQERGLYFARSWDPAYRSALEMHDPGEGPLEGSILVADVGEGRYVYTGVSFFRQLPAGVPGAYRLFMNLLALSEERGVP
jgi:LmbE family N-acetylglucosaminyl deacetylase